MGDRVRRIAFLSLAVLVVIGGSMGIGLPDWYNIKKAGAISALGDLGELAVRLGSIVSFDRRGDVVWLDGFEDGIGKWGTATSGTGAGVVSNAGWARNGGYSAKLTAGSDGNHLAEIYHLLHHPCLGKMGAESSFGLDTDVDAFWMQFDLYTGTRLLRARVRYDMTNHLVQYLNSANGLTTLETGVNLSVSGYPFYSWKVVVDFVEEEYVRLLLNEKLYDMAGISFYAVDFVWPAGLRLTLYNLGESGKNGVVYVDDVIITQNEL